MKNHFDYSAIQEALGAQEEMSADEKDRHLAEMREMALKNKNSELGAARRKGRKEGLEKGMEKGLEKSAVNLISMGALPMEQISQATGLSMDEVRSLRDAGKTRVS